MRVRTQWVLFCLLAVIATAALYALDDGAGVRPKAITAAVAQDHCAAPQPVPADTSLPAEAGLPAVAQPGGIDPLGASRLIQTAIEDCP